MGQIAIDIEQIKERSIRMNLALMDGVSKENVEQGQVIVMDIANNCVVGHASLRERNGEGGFVYRSHRVNKSDFMTVTLDEPEEYLETKDLCALPVDIIMPIISYLVLLEFGARPSDEVTWTEGVTSLEDLLVQGHYQPLEESAEMFLPDRGGTLNAVIERLGFLPPQPPQTLRDIQDIKIYPFQMLEWLNQLAKGEGLSYVFKPEIDNPNGPRKRIISLQGLLQRCGKEAMDLTERELKTPVSGYSFVSSPDNNHYRSIAFCGSFPADNPRYGIITWLHHKDSEELNDYEAKKLGKYAIDVTKTVADYIMSTQS